MNGDFSRDSFDRRYRFSRVLLQQGRVLLDSDWNEQTAILLHTIRSLAADLIGPHGGPGDGFKVMPDETGKDLRCDFRIGRGHYYVDGLLCENEPPAACGSNDGAPAVTWANQPDLPLDDEEKELDHDSGYFVYLDVWERHLTHLEAPEIREVALGGPDTATRAQVVWQVKVLNEDCCENRDSYTCGDWLAEVVKDLPRCLRARARVAAPSDDPCIIPPEARYRGAENQLYRVEIHDAGKAEAKGATWKWSRDNGSSVFALRSLQGTLATLDTLGPDDQRTLNDGDWVEIVDDRSVLRGRPGILARVEKVDRVNVQVQLSVPSDIDLPEYDEKTLTHPILRRWDHASAAIPVQAGKWIDLEDGVQVYFEPGGTYQTGDYWQIPARTATGDVLWPVELDSDGTPAPQALPPRGIRHHYAPLGRIKTDKDGIVTSVTDCRCVFPPLCSIAPVASPPAVEKAEPPKIVSLTATPNATDTCDKTAPVQFSAQVTGTEPISYEWNFMDNTPVSTDPAPKHKYTIPNTYSVTLEVSNAGGKAAAETEVEVKRCQQGSTAPTGTVTNTATVTKATATRTAKTPADTSGKP